MNHLRDISPWFRAVVTGESTVSAKPSINLPHDDADTFELFLQWVYTKTWPLSTNPDGDERYMQLARLYVFAGRYVVMELKNWVVDQFFEIYTKANETPGAEVISYVFESTTVSSPLRKLLARMYARNHQKYKTGKWANLLYHIPDFGAALALAFADRLESSPVAHRTEEYLGERNSYYGALPYVYPLSNCSYQIHSRMILLTHF